MRSRLKARNAREGRPDPVCAKTALDASCFTFEVLGESEGDTEVGLEVGLSLMPWCPMRVYYAATKGVTFYLIDITSRELRVEILSGMKIKSKQVSRKSLQAVQKGSDARRAKIDERRRTLLR
jgi:hypothetical protein